MADEIKAIIFDYGGVVAHDLKGLVKRIFRRVFNVDKKEINKHYHEIYVLSEKGKIDEKGIWETLAKKLQKPVFSKGCNGLLQKAYSKVTIQFRAIIKLVKQLKKNYTVALLSNTKHPFADYNIKNNRYRYFDPVVLSCKVGLIKPEKEIYMYMLKKLNLKAEECVFIDNEEKNIRGAREVGINSILFDANSHPITELIKELKKLGVKIPK